MARWKNLLEEISLWVRRVDAPPVIGEYIEDTEYDDEEDGWPFGFKANSNHDACGETEERNKHSCDAPCALKDETEEKENEENTTGKEEAAAKGIYRSNSE